MPKLTIATFISNSEKNNKSFEKFCVLLSKKFDIEVIVFTDRKIQIKEKNVKQIVQKNATKYKRIIELIKICNSENILCIDNDITISSDALEKFVKNFLYNDFELAWGKIKAKKTDGLFSNLIRIDKNLSHDYIRPLLWKMNIGISIPGQIFMMKKNSFINKLPGEDTVYDDLTIGMIARKYKLKVYYSNCILGQEMPKCSFHELIKQRKRWAKGFAQSLKTGKKEKMLRYTLIHGFSYHFLWIIFYLILVLIGLKSYIVSILIFLITGIILSENSIKDFFYAIMYMVIFPNVHIIWGIELIKNLFLIRHKKIQ